MDFRKIVKEARKPMKKKEKKEQWWFDIPGAKHIYHGDWSDPEIQYKGFSLNYWDVIDGMSDAYREEHPEDKDEKGFDAWMEEQGGPGGYLQGELDNCVYACLGDDGLEDEEWLGIPDAYKVKEVYGQGDGDFVLYKDCLVNISDFDYYDKDYDDYFTYENDPQGFEAYYIDKANRGELIDQLNSAVRGMVPNINLLDESWLGDKMAAAGKWIGQKTGDVATGTAKAVGKAASATAKGIGKAAAATGKVALKAGKAVGKAAGKAAWAGTKAAGKVAGKAAKATGKAVGKAAIATGKAAGKATARGASKLYDKFVNGNNTGELKKGEDVVVQNKDGKKVIGVVLGFDKTDSIYGIQVNDKSKQGDNGKSDGDEGGNSQDPTKNSTNQNQYASKGKGNKGAGNKNNAKATKKAAGVAKQKQQANESVWIPYTTSMLARIRVVESVNCDESWLGDKMKDGWNKVKAGAKKVGKAIGDAFNGPFRTGDQITMTGEDGEVFKGTITDFDFNDKTYEVLLGNAVGESFDDGVHGTQEQVLDMPDREDELVWMIQDTFWHLADLGDPDILRELIENCVELEKVKPGRLKEIISEEF